MTPKEESVNIIRKEIGLILDRDKDETYLKSVLTRALILEKLHKK